MIYHVSVITGEVKYAGTDAKVYIQLQGSEGNSEIHRLHNPRAGKKEFDRGQIDHFQVINFMSHLKLNKCFDHLILLFKLLDVNVGKLKAVRIWHDNSGAAPGWMLDTVIYFLRF
jgi:hypothetical protein